MSREAKIHVAHIVRDKDQPRVLFDESDLIALGENMKALGQQVPIIAYENAGKAMLLDGERRWRAAQLVGITELNAIVLPSKPDQATLHILQMSLEAHKVGLTAMERSNLLAKIKAENGWAVGELASRLNMKQPLVSKLLTFQKLSPEAQQLLHTGKIDMEKAHILSQRPVEEQAELLKGAEGISRDQLRMKLKASGNKPKAKRAQFSLPSGLSITLHGIEVTLEQAIDGMMAAVKELKKGLGQGLDISTAQKVMADKARAS